MRQRNDTGAIVEVAGIDHPIGPGHIIDHEQLVVGFTAIETDSKKTTKPKPIITPTIPVEPSPTENTPEEN